MFALTDPNIRGLLQGEHPESLAQSDPPPVDLSVGGIRSQIAAEWLQIAQRSQWRAYRKPPSLFLMVPSMTPTTSFSQKHWGFICPPHTRMAISLQRVIRSTSCLVLVFGDGGSNGAISQVAISLQPVVLSTSCFVLGRGFQGRWI